MKISIRRPISLFLRDTKIFVRMEIKLLAFGIVRDFFGGPSIEVELEDGATVSALKAYLETRYPAIRRLSSCLVAVNNDYAGDEQVLERTDEIAIIPPVSGG